MALTLRVDPNINKDNNSQKYICIYQIIFFYHFLIMCYRHSDNLKYFDE